MKRAEKQCESENKNYFQIFKLLHFQIKEALPKIMADRIPQGLHPQQVP